MAPKFGLQSVLDYRHSRVEMLEVELGRLNQTRLHCVNTLAVLKENHQQISHQLSKQQQGEVAREHQIDLFMIAQLHANLKAIEDSIFKQQNRLVELDRQIHTKQNEVVHARRDEEVLARLKSKELERFQAEQVEQEKRDQDDIYVTRAQNRHVLLR